MEARARRTPQHRADGVARASRFMENLFPYELPPLTRHYVLWFLLDLDEDEHSAVGLTDDFIQQEVEKALRDATGGDSFAFVWYRNPYVQWAARIASRGCFCNLPRARRKPSIVDGVTYHVQVFWRDFT